MKKGETLKIKAHNGNIVKINTSEEVCQEFGITPGEKRRHKNFGEATILGIGPATDPSIGNVVWYILEKALGASYNVLFRADDWQKVS